MLAYCVYVLKVAGIDRLMPFLVACHCAIFSVNVLFCYYYSFFITPDKGSTQIQ